MRGFFILLLLTNVAYFIWQYSISETDTPVRVETPPQQGKSLVMLAELPDEQSPIPHASQKSPSPPSVHPVPRNENEDTSSQAVMPHSAETRCFVVNQIETSKQQDNLIVLLRSAGAKGIEQGEMAGVRESYWVMLPPHADKAAAETSVRLLIERQLKDFFIVRGGEYENAISLGVFSGEEGAKRRKGQVDQLQLSLPEAKIERIELPTREFWLRYRITAVLQTDMRQKLEDAGRIVEEKCP